MKEVKLPEAAKMLLVDEAQRLEKKLARMVVAKGSICAKKNLTVAKIKGCRQSAQATMLFPCVG